MKTVTFKGQKPKPQVSISIHWINGWLKWSGFRVFVSFDPLREFDESDPKTWVRIGVLYYGWRDL